MALPSPPRGDDTPPESRLAGLVLLYLVATAAGAVAFIALMRLAAAFGPGIMFYRGVAALAATGLLLILAGAIILPALPRRFGLGAADALGGAIVATSLLTAVFVLGPVTVDRSISVFLLAQFDAADRPLSADEARDKFVRTYVTEWDQIGRRLAEQESSGNLERTKEGWRLTPQGRRFMQVARSMSALFGGDPRFVGRKD